MTWFHVDDGFWGHPKLDGMSHSAIALWVVAGSWCARYLKDGVVPRDRVAKLGFSVDHASELVRSAMWDEHESGYQFHDWDHYQETKQDVEHKRERWRSEKLQKRTAKSDGKSKMSAPDSGPASAADSACPLHSSPLHSDPSDPRGQSAAVAAATPGASVPKKPTPAALAKLALAAAVKSLAESFGHDVPPTASKAHQATGASKVLALMAKGAEPAQAAERVARAAYERMASGKATSFGWALNDCVIGGGVSAANGGETRYGETDMFK